METEFDRSIRDALPTPDDATQAVALDNVDRRLRAAMREPQRRRRSHRRVVMVVALVACLTSATAIAASDGVREAIGISSPTAERMKVFRAPAEKPPADIQERFDQMSQSLTTDPNADLGPLADGTARLLVREEGEDTVAEIWGVLTERGAVCFAAIIGPNRAASGGGFGCVAFPKGRFPVGESTHISGGQETWYGAVPDGVVAVRIGDDRRLYDMTMGRNAFVWFRPPGASIRLMEAEFADGTRIRKELYARPGAAAPREPYVVPATAP